jgi:hypothetical protein
VAMIANTVATTIPECFATTSSIVGQYERWAT